MQGLLHRIWIKGLLAAMGLLMGLSSTQAQTVFVWPGDANDNGLVNHVDLLYLGLSYGFTGPGRDSVSIDWQSHEVPKWLTPIQGRVDPAHADCNGDSIVDVQDLQAIEVNYGRDNGFITADSSSISSLAVDPPLSFSFPGDSFAAGSRDTIPLNLGSAQFPVDSLLGFAATISYDTSLVDTAYAWFGDSWLGTPEQDLLTFNRTAAGQVEMSATRTDRQDRLQGQGRIGGIVVVMDDNLKSHAAIASLQLEFTQVLCLSVGRTVKAVHPMADSVKIYRPSSLLQARIYPNPTRERLHIDLVDPNPEPVSLKVYDLRGSLREQRVFDPPGITWECQGLRPGVYIVEVSQNGQIHRKKVIILN